MKTFSVDFGAQLGPFKPLHGVNGGPWVRAGTYDLSEAFRAILPPVIRLHDCPYYDPYAVDIHCIFPDFGADENDPASYRFEGTDDHLRPILDLGIEIIFRLGESIEHGKRTYHIHPPPDPAKWARVCANIVRHYTQGWAGGFRWNVRRWEIWNEPDIPQCWSGDIDQYLELYRHAAPAVKAANPDVMVGGPSAAFPGAERGDLLRRFLVDCREHGTPVDFVSWHNYARHPKGMMEHVRVGLATVRECGFEGVETHFTEWNMAPGAGAWGFNNTTAVRDAFTQRTMGLPGVAFTAAMLAFLQDSGVDLACYYCACGGIYRFGFFDRYNAPLPPYYAFVAFRALTECGTRVGVEGGDPETGRGIVAAIDPERRRGAVLLSNFDDPESRFRLRIDRAPMPGAVRCAEYVVDGAQGLVPDREHVLDGAELVVDLPAPSLRLLRFEQAAHETS